MGWLNLTTGDGDGERDSSDGDSRANPMADLSLVTVQNAAATLPQDPGKESSHIFPIGCLHLFQMKYYYFPVNALYSSATDTVQPINIKRMCIPFNKVNSNKF
ncbi:hypothetical protein F2Q70_00000474 [Brassica cretica]|uniref:Uncharacterized protein n=1 Tax=Brassica cretica TaxID=69181 RepID=A0A8S9IQ64_BRACR|nr:hypothetical protein F2Q70_00000474 [Brassica cretica]